MTITITAEQRDALYDQIVGRLPGIDSIWHAVAANDFEAAQRLGWEFSDFLRLVLDDLGWGDGPGESIELGTPPDVLRRAFERLQCLGANQQAIEAKERAGEEKRIRLLLETCKAGLATLDGEGAV